MIKNFVQKTCRSLAGNEEIMHSADFE